MRRKKSATNEAPGELETWAGGPMAIRRDGDEILAALLILVPSFRPRPGSGFGLNEGSFFTCFASLFRNRALFAELVRDPLLQSGRDAEIAPGGAPEEQVEVTLGVGVVRSSEPLAPPFFCELELPRDQLCAPEI